MNEELQKTLASLVDASKAGMIKAVEVLKEQFPEVTKEILMWETSIGIIMLLLGVILSILTIWMTRTKWFKEIIELSDGAIFGVPIALNAISLTFILANIIKITQICVAPRLFLFNYVSNLLN